MNYRRKSVLFFRVLLITLALVTPSLASFVEKEPEKTHFTRGFLSSEEPLQDFFKNAASTFATWAPAPVKAFTQKTYKSITQWLSSTILDLPPYLFAKMPSEINYNHDKAFWLAHFSDALDEINQMKPNKLNGPFLQERLGELQEIIWHQLLSPYVYEQGLTELQSTMPAHKADVEAIRGNFRKTLMCTPAFTQGALCEDMTSFIHHVWEGEADSLQLMHTLWYYKNLTSPLDYKHTLVTLRSYLQTHKKELPLTIKEYRETLQAIKAALEYSDKKARRAAKAARSSFITHVAELPYFKAENEDFFQVPAKGQQRLLQTSQRTLSASYLNWSLTLLSSGANYALHHPFQTLTLGIAAQVSAAAALQAFTVHNQPEGRMKSRSYQRQNDPSSQNHQPRSFIYKRDTGVFQVSTDVSHTKSFPSVSGLNDGTFVAAWTSNYQDGDGYGIFGQRYFNNGTRIGNEFQVNTYTTSYQNYPSVSGLNDGSFVVTWQSAGPDGSGYGIFGQRYGNDGTRLGSEFQVNTYTLNDQTSPSASALSDGSFVVTWASDGQDGSLDGVYGQRFGNDGTRLGSEFQVNTYTTYTQYFPSVSGLNNGSFVVSWVSDYQDGDRLGIYGQRYGNDGTRLGSEFQVNTYTLNDQTSPSASGLSDGSFVFVWQSVDQNGYKNIYGQRYFNNGTLIGSQFQVSISQLKDQGCPSVSGLSDDRFVVTWQNFGQGGSADVYGQYYFNNGTRIGNEFQVNTHTTNIPTYPSVSGLDDDSFVVTWDDSFIYGRIYISADFLPLTTGTTGTTGSITTGLRTTGTTGTTGILTTGKLGNTTTISHLSTTARVLSPDSLTTTDSTEINKGLIIGPVVGVAALSAAGAGIWKYVTYKNKHAEKERERFPFANKLKEKLQLDIQDFNSKQGRAYVDAVQLLIGKLENYGINAKPTDPIALEELSDMTADTIRQTLSLTSTRGGKSFALNALSLEHAADQIATALQAKIGEKEEKSWQLNMQYSLPVEENTINIEMHSLRGSLSNL